MSTDAEVGPKLIETAKSATRDFVILSAKLGTIGVLILAALKLLE